MAFLKSSLNEHGPVCPVIETILAQLCGSKVISLHFYTFADQFDILRDRIKNLPKVPQSVGELARVSFSLSLGSLQ